MMTSMRPERKAPENPAVAEAVEEGGRRGTSMRPERKAPEKRGSQGAAARPALRGASMRPERKAPENSRGWPYQFSTTNERLLQ